MPLSLNDIKNNKDKKNENSPALKAKNIKKTPLKRKKASSKKTKPWEKMEEINRHQFHHDDNAPLALRVINWGKKVKIYPELSIPLPNFLLSKESKDD